MGFTLAGSDTDAGVVQGQCFQRRGMGPDLQGAIDHQCPRRGHPFIEHADLAQQCVIDHPQGNHRQPQQDIGNHQPTHEIHPAMRWRLAIIWSVAT